ncbi:hypothetical protein F0562_034399 [Nyssa sinensis]|uniref:Uncharacterized protein n=1 Tax=Nyssa sinensis TaxID=561372 RepID=A0A5J5AKI1_9ASTE|nr:hypothetical protein F0562_034399 [Nyssa sinensis]
MSWLSHHHRLSLSVSVPILPPSLHICNSFLQLLSAHAIHSLTPTSITLQRLLGFHPKPSFSRQPLD